MARQRESKLSSDIQKELRKKGAFCFKVWGNEHMMVGLPDIMGTFKGRFFGLEVKMPESRGNVSPAQQLRQQQIRAAGGVAEVVCSVSEAVAVMLHLDDPDWLQITRSADDA